MYFFDKKGRQYARRTKINTGYKCNLRCQFCYYYDNLCKLDDDFNEIKKQLDYAKKIGIQHIDFSGGESTIHKDFIKMVSYSRKLGFKTICTLTNGSAFSNMEYLKKSKDAGLNEILFSLHGANRENHDEITQVKGSYDRLLAAIKNAHALGIKSRFNVTVNKINYRGIVNQTSLINELKPFQVNYIVFNEWADGKKVAGKLGVNYSEVSKEIKKAVDHLKGIKSINVRYIPFCFMKGYEKYITNTINHLYDPYEWYPYARAKFEANSNFKFLFILFYTFLISRKFNFNENLNNANKINYTKIDKCKNCKLRKICGGFTKTYLKLNPKTDVIPYSLKEGLIKDPIFFKETSQFPIEKKDLTFIIANDPIRGAAYSRNYQIRLAKSDFLLIKDEDVIISEEVISKMKKALNSADIVYPKIRENILNKNEFISEGPLRNSTCFMIKKSTIEKCNLWFDEKYFIYGEDNDFFIRCRLKKLKFKQINELVDHNHFADKFFLKWRFYLELRNYIYSLLKWKNLDPSIRTIMKYPFTRGLFGRIRDLLRVTYNPFLVLRTIFDGLKLYYY